MRLPCFLAAGALLAALAPAAVAQDRADFTGWVDTTFAFDARGSVELSQISGDVVVSTWNRDEIRIRAYAEHVELETRFSRSRVYVGLDLDRLRDNDEDEIGDSRFEITMPATARLEAKSISGDVQVHGAAGRVRAASVSGDVTVEGGSDEISAASVSGDVQVSGTNGRVDVRTVSGDLTLRDANGDVSATTVSGDLLLQDVRARIVTAKTVSGEVEFGGPIASDGRYELNSHSGSITLRLPGDARGRLSISTFSGDIDSDIPVTLGANDRFGPGRGSLEVRLGDGSGATIQVKTFSGDVVIRHRR